MIVYIKWISFSKFYLLFLEKHIVQVTSTHKGVEKYILYCLVVSGVQNQTLKINQMLGQWCNTSPYYHMVLLVRLGGFRNCSRCCCITKYHATTNSWTKLELLNHLHFLQEISKVVFKKTHAWLMWHTVHLGHLMQSSLNKICLRTRRVAIVRHLLVINRWVTDNKQYWFPV